MWHMMRPNEYSHGYIRGQHLAGLLPSLEHSQSGQRRDAVAVNNRVGIVVVLESVSSGFREPSGYQPHLSHFSGVSARHNRNRRYLCSAILIALLLRIIK